MNAHLIHFVEGPLASDFIAANDAVFDVPPQGVRDKLTLLLAVDADGDRPNATPIYASAEDEYYLGGYAAI